MRVKTFIVAIGLMIVLLAAAGTAPAKSAYLMPNHHSPYFNAYNINADGTVTYQSQYNWQWHGDPADIAMHNGDSMLFASGEGFGGKTGLEVFTADTFQYIGHFGNIGNLAGVAVDEVNNYVYAMRRANDDLYRWDWDGTAQTLSNQTHINLGYGCRGYGIDLDVATGTLRIADPYVDRVRVFDTSTWMQTALIDLTHDPVDITYDRVRGLTYTVSSSYGHGTPAGSSWLSKWDGLTETLYQLGAVGAGRQGVGVAVDEVTGYVYVTVNDGSVEVWNTATGTKLQDLTSGISSSVAGICIGNAGWIPPDLTFTKTLIGLQDVLPGGPVQFRIDWAYAGSTPLTNAAILDSLDPMLLYGSHTGGGTYSSGQVTWTLGTVNGGDSGSFDLFATLSPNAQFCNWYWNSATFSADQLPPVTREAAVHAGNYIPEPVTVISFLLGLGLLGGIARRRKSRA